MSIYDLVEKRVNKQYEIESENARIYADYVCNLFDDVIKYESIIKPVGGFTLFQKDFKLLGKKEVPCIFHDSEDETVIILDYSFIWGKAIRNDKKINSLILEKLLNEKGISISYDTEQTETCEKEPNRWKYLLIFSKKKKVQSRTLNGEYKSVK